MNSRREVLKKFSSTQASHAGLWLDKYIASQERDDIGTRQTLVREVSGIKIPDSYHHFLGQWKTSLNEYGAFTRKATVQGRMVVGLGNESVLETSVTLHRTYGVPYIPGSALKGMAASYARTYLGDEWKEESTSYTIVFGNTEEAGFVTFFDALYVPHPDNPKSPLAPDVITVHHPEYYRGEGKAPADWDSPTPIPFLTATGTYLLALAGPEDWVKVVFRILEYALQEMGVGAKTSSGYGRLVVEEGTPDETKPPSDPGQQQVNDILDRLAKLQQSRVANEINSFFLQWRDLQVSVPLKQQIAKAILDKVREAGRERKSSTKEWYKELAASLEQKDEE